MVARAPTFFLVLVALLSAGCMQGDKGDLGREHELGKDLTVVADAGEVWRKPFHTNGGKASFEFHLTDDSTVDIGFMRTQNVDAWENGSASTLYGGNESVQRATNSVTLETGDWTLVIRCRNAIADCDGILDRASYFSS